MNKFMIEARLTKPAEHKTSQNGNEYVVLNLAQSKKNQQGEFESLYVRASCFKYNVKKAQPLQKGDRVFVCGAISMDSYKDKQGETRYSLNMLVDEILPLAARPAYEGANSQSVEDFAQQFAPAQQSPWEAASLSGEGIPF